jgi:hypothetical protein
MRLCALPNIGAFIFSKGSALAPYKGILAADESTAYVKQLLAETRLRFVHAIAFRVACKNIARFLRHDETGVALVRRRVIASLEALRLRLCLIWSG